MEEMGTLHRDTMAKIYKRLCIRIEALWNRGSRFLICNILQFAIDGKNN
jgi:hypothetical protein